MPSKANQNAKKEANYHYRKITTFIDQSYSMTLPIRA